MNSYIDIPAADVMSFDSDIREEFDLPTQSRTYMGYEIYENGYAWGANKNILIRVNGYGRGINTHTIIENIIETSEGESRTVLQANDEINEGLSKIENYNFVNIYAYPREGYVFSSLSFERDILNVDFVVSLPQAEVQSSKTSLSSIATDMKYEIRSGESFFFDYIKGKHIRDTESFSVDDGMITGELTVEPEFIKESRPFIPQTNS
jgi:hypothetical protein